MSVVLALPEKGAKVSVCGRLVDVPSDSLASVTLLRRDLAQQIKLGTPTALQLADITGRPIRSDDELVAALRDGRHPLQAKLTVVAVHEIEQKKHEAETKKEELIQLQWQIVVEQIASFSAELASVGAQLQTVKDDSWKAVRQFEEAEELRRNQLMTTISQETAEREASQRDMLARMERLMSMLSAERSARDVAVHQLGKQSEQVAADLDNERNVRSKEQAENCRSLSALRHELDLESHKHADLSNKAFEAQKRLEGRQDDHTAAQIQVTNQLQTMECDIEKVRNMCTNMEKEIVATRQAAEQDLHRRSDELDRAVRDGISGRDHDITRLAKDLETSWQALEVRVQRSRDESLTNQAKIDQRTKILEQRCADLEGEHIEHRNVIMAKDHNFLDKINFAVKTADNSEVDRKASEVVVRSLALKVEDLMERMRTAEVDLTGKEGAGHLKPHVDAFYRMFQKQEEKLKFIEREMGNRFSQEAEHREGIKASLQDSLGRCLEKAVSARDKAVLQEQNAHRMGSPPRSPRRALVPAGSHMNTNGMQVPIKTMGGTPIAMVHHALTPQNASTVDSLGQSGGTGAMPSSPQSMSSASQIQNKMSSRLYPMLSSSGGHGTPHNPAPPAFVGSVAMAHQRQTEPIAASAMMQHRGSLA